MKYIKLFEKVISIGRESESFYTKNILLNDESVDQRDDYLLAVINELDNNNVYYKIFIHIVDEQSIQIFFRKIKNSKIGDIFFKFYIPKIKNNLPKFNNGYFLKDLNFSYIEGELKFKFKWNKITKDDIKQLINTRKYNL